ncbi:MAG: hypothetical protein DI586_02735 [Micavibrio aeruginosavorus]|uniref:DUF3619 domain-containing protein n=1 Tax=Micavibrio aeruginosavorus TaxID=349221 RepID=A0A2W5FP07_9BACT|nr:MAG: hypothetical protein DI586_02735 [Micavibrio aeruginosavorus]
MDITKLFENDKIEKLDNEKLEFMIEAALAHPQIRVPANENNRRFRHALAIAAALVMAITFSLQYMPNTMPDLASDDNNEIYNEISDLIILETMNDLS